MALGSLSGGRVRFDVVEDLYDVLLERTHHVAEHDALGPGTPSSLPQARAGGWVCLMGRPSPALPPRAVIQTKVTSSAAF
jgi:hypothetical protein